jgi:C1A family cysteine protease
MFKKLTSAACLVSSTFANINTDFASVLHGEDTFNYLVFEKIWAQYTNQLKSVSTAEDATRK